MVQQPCRAWVRRLLKRQFEAAGLFRPGGRYRCGEFHGVWKVVEERSGLTWRAEVVRDGKESSCRFVLEWSDDSLFTELIFPECFRVNELRVFDVSTIQQRTDPGDPGTRPSLQGSEDRDCLGRER